MPILLDTSVLARLANVSDAAYPVADRAVSELHRAGELLHITSQVLVEFRNVGTRAVSLNGLGLSIPDVEAKSTVFEQTFQLLPETPDIHPAWKSLVAAARVVGKQVHDARLAAICQVHGVSKVLTFNTAHFKRFTAFMAGLTIIDPATI